MDGNLQRPIQRLTEDVVNRIAAGEVVQRPSAAIKELIENALDAGASSLKVIVKDGGLKLLQISDNGHGIRKDDLGIVCERFTTSKITKFEDLESVTTYGFRGEALASITHVANVTITTKRKDDPCAWKAAYRDGQLIPLQPGQSAAPTPCAGNDGTTITVEDMFFNMPSRRMALKNHSEEYQRILDVTSRYAVHNAGVSFSCKKHPSPSVDLATLTGSSTIDVIRQVYGSSVANDLLPLELTDESKGVIMKGLVSNPNYSARRFTFLLFINHRMVESPAIKKAIESVYYSLLPKGSHPFGYISLQLRPDEIDVNMHPTKQEIGLLNEDALIGLLTDGITKVLANVNESRTFSAQTTLPKNISAHVVAHQALPEMTGSQKVALSQQKMIRYDSKVQSILAFTADEDGNSGAMKRRRIQADDAENPYQNGETLRKSSRTLKQIIPSDCRLTSIISLRDEVDVQQHKGLTNILLGHTFVGIVDPEKSLSLIQNGTQLYLCNHSRLSESFFYQLGLVQFGDYSRVRLKPPPALDDLIEIALDGEEQDDFPIPRPALKKRVIEQLQSTREMLRDYFSIVIDDDDHLTSLPLLHPEHLPNLEDLPSFLLRLALEVGWKVEKDCFQGILQELSYFYTADFPAESDDTQDQAGQITSLNWRIEHKLYPSMRRNFKPPKSLLEHDVVQIANLPDLYRVFERC